MQTKTALAVAGSVLAVPSTALATVHDTTVPGHEALRASGRLNLSTHDRDRLVRTNLRLARREARLSGHRLRKGHARRVRDDTVSVIRARNHRLRGRIARLQGSSTASAGLEAIAACESGGNPSANTGNGFYGKYQFTHADLGSRSAAPATPPPPPRPSRTAARRCSTRRRAPRPGPSAGADFLRGR